MGSARREPAVPSLHFELVFLPGQVVAVACHADQIPQTMAGLGVHRSGAEQTADHYLLPGQRDERFVKAFSHIVASLGQRIASCMQKGHAAFAYRRERERVAQDGMRGEADRRPGGRVHAAVVRRYEQ